jgi:hypothetical protein
MKGKMKQKKHIQYGLIIAAILSCGIGWGVLACTTMPLATDNNSACKDCSTGTQHATGSSCSYTSEDNDNDVFCDCGSAGCTASTTVSCSGRFFSGNCDSSGLCNDNVTQTGTWSGSKTKYITGCAGG